MLALVRAATAAFVAVALAALPVLLDRCETSCDVHRAAAAAAASPSCHHGPPPGSRVGGSPAPCGHDHSGTVATAAVGAASPTRGGASIVADVAPATASAHAAVVRFVRTHAPPGLLTAFPPTPLPLRI